MNPVQLGQRALPLVVAAAVLAGTAPSASAFGKRSKPWERKAKTEQVSTPTANVASSTTKKKRGLFGRVRNERPERTTTQTRTRSSQPSQVSVRATARTTTPTNTRPQRKKREGLLVRMFKPDPPQSRPASANVAVQKKRVVTPHPGQAPPKYNHTLIGQAK